MDYLPPRHILSELALKPIFENTGWLTPEEDESNYSYNTEDVYADLFCKKCNEIKTFTGEAFSETDLHSNPLEQVYRTREGLILGHAYSASTNSEENNEGLNETTKENLFEVENTIAIQLECPKCQSPAYMYYVIEKKTKLSKERRMPLVTSYRVHKIGEFPDQAKSRLRHLAQYKEHFPEEYQFLMQAEKSYRNGLGAGAIIYIRKAYENLTKSILERNGKENVKNNFRGSLEKADEIADIIPPLLKNRAYGLFRELSDIVHRETDTEGLKKFESLRDLFIHILNKILENRKLEKFAENIRLDEPKQQTSALNKALSND